MADVIIERDEPVVHVRRHALLRHGAGFVLYALLAFFALSNVDIIVARNVLSDHDAGLYAAGLIITGVMGVLMYALAVVIEAGLSLLGLGTAPPTPSSPKHTPRHRPSVR